MIEASVAAVPGLLVSFLVLAVVVGTPTALAAKALGRPWPLRTALAVQLAAVLAVTLLPGDAGLPTGQCDTGAPWSLFTSESSLLNIALFAPAGFLAVRLFRRPVTVAAAGALLSATVELSQSAVPSGRSCSVTDLVANATGAVAGSLAGALWLRLRRTPPRGPLRDLLGGVALAAAGAVAVTAVFDSRVTGVDVVALDEHHRGLAESSVRADEWLTSAARDIYGSGTEITGAATERSGDRLRITVDTNRGSVSGWWPDRELVSASSSHPRGGAASLSGRQVSEAADVFARRWFPQYAAGRERAVRSVEDGVTRTYRVTYRRHTEGVMTPMRLDLTIAAATSDVGVDTGTSTGTGTGTDARVIAFSAGRDEDAAPSGRP
ncbi:VanZ family protein [Streptomyces sp. NPDC020597]|uniref:VanZ family protein n=1 Tax=unclassified Streptomyces TaxID=2593676 RepID=UPI0037AAFD6E